MKTESSWCLLRGRLLESAQERHRLENISGAAWRLWIHVPSSSDSGAQGRLPQCSFALTLDWYKGYNKKK
jgi:hypothetical protein